MESIFFEIKNAIQANAPEIKWIDLDEGQLENFESPPVDYPCLLVGFPQGNYSNYGDAQVAELSLTIKLGFKVWEKFNAAVPISSQNMAFEHFNIIRKVAKALHGLPGGERSELMRVRMQKNNSPDPKVYEIVFECNYYDNNTMVDYGSIPKPDLEIVQD